MGGLRRAHSLNTVGAMVVGIIALALD